MPKKPAFLFINHLVQLCLMSLHPPTPTPAWGHNGEQRSDYSRVPQTWMRNRFPSEHDDRNRSPHKRRSGKRCASPPTQTSRGKGPATCLRGDTSLSKAHLDLAGWNAVMRGTSRSLRTQNRAFGFVVQGSWGAENWCVGAGGGLFLVLHKIPICWNDRECLQRLSSLVG